MVLLSSEQKVLKKGDKAPDFALLDIDGRKKTLSSLKGEKCTLVIFICNHCPYVKPKFEYLVHLQKTYGHLGLSIIGINPNDSEKYPEDSYENMQKVHSELGLNFPYLYDETQDVARSYGAVCTPDPFLFDSNLLLAYHGRIDDAHKKPHSEASTSELEDAIRELIFSGTCSVREIPSFGCSIKWRF